MQFCTECGGALNLFESNDDKVCWNCVQKKEKKKPQPAPNAVNETVEDDDLSEAVLYTENATMILRAKEGWVLWSGPADKKVSLENILNRARRIHAIRKKRHNSKN